MSKRSKSNQLEQLRELTVVVADTGEFKQIAKYKPRDVTTNPSLVYKASQIDEYKPLIEQAKAYAMTKANTAAERTAIALDKVCVLFGKEVLKVIEGRVSTEVDARLSFDTNGTIERVKRLKAMYEEEGVDTARRVLFKVAATWEGIKAAEILEAEGVHCNLTLIFAFAQAVACAEAKVTLISPFVGRIYDYWKKAKGVDGFAPADDPGAQSVTRIYNYYKAHGYKTIVMGASFRNTDQVTQLAGCDYLTLSPAIMDQLEASDGVLERMLAPDKAATAAEPRLSLDEKRYRWLMCQDEMATAKLAEGIRAFAADIEKLEQVLSK